MGFPRDTRTILRALADEGKWQNDGGRLDFPELLQAAYGESTQEAYQSLVDALRPLETALLIRYFRWTNDPEDRIIVLTDMGQEYLEYRGRYAGMPEVKADGPRLRPSLLAS
jgi:hypothetical protein